MSSSILTSPCGLVLPDQCSDHENPPWRSTWIASVARMAATYSIGDSLPANRPRSLPSERLFVVLGAIHTHPLEIRCHQQLASALKSAPNTGSQRWLAHHHLTDSIRRDADSFHHGGSLTGTDRAAAIEQINVTCELPSPRRERCRSARPSRHPLCKHRARRSRSSRRSGCPH